MKTFDLGPHDPLVLAGELKSAGVPVVTINSSFAERRAKTALYGVLFTEDAANSASVQAVIAAHKPTNPSPGAPPPAEVAAAQKAMKGIKDPEPVVEEPEPTVILPAPEPAPKVICNVCQLEITNPVEAEKDRIYLVKGSGRILPAQKKHDACDVEYRKKKGLQKREDLEAMPREIRARFVT